MDVLPHLNYVDVAIIIAALVIVLRGVQEGVLRVSLRLVAFLAGLAAAFWGYQAAAIPISNYFHVGPPLSYVLGFIAIFVFAQILLSVCITLLTDAIPGEAQTSSLSRFLAIIPAGADAAIFVSLCLVLALVLPLPQGIKDDITTSYIGSPIVDRFSGVERYLNQTFGDAIEEALARLMVHPESDESVSIPFRPSTLTIEPESEQEMLELINEERRMAGMSPLVFDEEIMLTARAHSRDMWERGYFAHENPDGEDAFDRMKDDGIEFGLAGENLALAPTLGLAHRGLMNSPGHRANILEPDYRRVGIGIIAGGRYGLMVTQNFAD
jgi:hypothetical protein